MSDREPTDRIIAQRRALIRAIEALSTIQPSDPFQRALARLLSEEILTASERIGDNRAVFWMSDNPGEGKAI